MRAVLGAGRYAAMRCTSTATGGRNAVDARRQRGGREKLVMGPASSSWLQTSGSAVRCDRLQGVENRIEIVPRDAGGLLNSEDVATWQCVSLLKPSPDGGLRHTDKTSHCCLRANADDRFTQRLLWGGVGAGLRDWHRDLRFEQYPAVLVINALIGSLKQYPRV